MSQLRRKTAEEFVSVLLDAVGESRTSLGRFFEALVNEMIRREVSATSMDYGRIVHVLASLEDAESILGDNLFMFWNQLSTDIEDLQVHMSEVNLRRRSLGKDTWRNDMDRIRAASRLRLRRTQYSAIHEITQHDAYWAYTTCGLTLAHTECVLPERIESGMISCNRCNGNAAQYAAESRRRNRARLASQGGPPRRRKRTSAKH